MIDKCNICGTERQNTIGGGYSIMFKDLLFLDKDYTQQVDVCPNCGFIYTANPFSEEQLNTRYKEFSKFEFDDVHYFLDEADSYKKRCLRQKQFIEASLDAGSFESMLEVGAASGYNLSLYTDKDVFGIEPSKNNVMNAWKNYGISMYAGMFNEYMAQPDKKKYDLIFLSHTLEHIVNPRDFISSCASLSNKFFFIEVPTLDYKFVNEPFGMFAEEHVNIFTLESLQHLMNSFGYNLVDAEIIFNVNETLPAGWPAISTVWKKSDAIVYQRPCISSRQLFDLYIHVSELEFKKIQTIIDTIPDSERIAVWGTGHHASMLLANTSLSDKNIVRVYDSDKKKAGQIFAGCPVQAFSADDITSDAIDSILLATYTAQKTLERILEPYKGKITIRKLYDV